MWNLQDAEARMANYTHQLLVNLKLSHGIFLFAETRSNIVLSNNKKFVKIARRCFARESGIAVYYEKIKGDEVIIREVTDSMFYSIYMRAIILSLFKED